MLLSLSLVAHADGRRIMVGAHNTIDVTVECQMHVVSSYSGMADIGICYTVDA